MSAIGVLETLAALCFTIAMVIALSDEHLVKHRLLLWITIALCLTSAILLVVTLIRRGLDIPRPDDQAKHNRGRLDDPLSRT